MALGSVTVAITLTLPPHLGQTLMSRLNTRLSRAIQLIGGVGAGVVAGWAAGSASSSRDDEMAVAGIGGEQAVVAHQVGLGPRHQSGQAGNKVLRFEQDVSGPVTKGTFELEDHQPIAIDTQTRLGDGRAGHVTAHTFELGPLVRLAGDGTVERKAITCGGEGFDRLATLVTRARVLNAHSGSPGLGTDGDDVAYRGA